MRHATRDMDFGRCFYVTIEVNQASLWATRLGKKNRTSGEVVKFEIPESDFNNLNNKSFNTTNDEWGSTVVDGRKGVQPSYDTVSGPMLTNIDDAVNNGVTLLGKGQQTTFLSDRAVRLLNNGMKGKS